MTCHPRPRPALLCALLVPWGLALAADADKPAADPTFTIKPGSIILTRQRSWQAEDGSTYDDQSFRLRLRVYSDQPSAIMGWSDLKVDEVTTDAGEKLHQRKNRGQREGGQVDFENGRRGTSERPVFDVEFNLEQPQLPIASLGTVSGTFTAQIAMGAPKRAELKPYKDIRGKVLEISGVPDGEMQVEKVVRGTRNGVMLRFPAELKDRLLKVSFFSATGQELETNGWGGGGGEDGEQKRTYFVNLPEDGAVVLSIRPKTRPLVVPFSVSGFDLPGPAPKAKTDRVKVAVSDDLPKEPPAAGETLKVTPVATPAAEKPAF